MPFITALLHTYNDALRVGRCLETLYPCDEILIVDGGSTDGTIEVAREYGARVVIVEAHRTPWDSPGFVRSMQPTDSAGNTWVLCLDPRESLSESLATSLFEWKSQPAAASAFSVSVREETAAGWVAHPSPETRLVPRDWDHWNGTMPFNDGSALPLEGELLRFALP